MKTFNHSRILAIRSSQSGFSLIEILIAMLILAVGVLGIAALQFKGLQYSSDSHFRSQISTLASDISDRMRINRANAPDYIGLFTLSTTNKPINCNEVTGAAAANDLECWRAQVHDALPPTSKANIAGVAGTLLYTVTLSWPDRENVGQFRDVAYTFQP
jgi:type IV pilus assembly protein PilV